MTGKLRSPLLYSGSPLAWAAAKPTGTSLRLVTRAVTLRKGTDGWMHSLMARLPGTGLAPDDAAAEAYLDVLAEVLSDGRLTGEEAKLLATWQAPQAWAELRYSRSISDSSTDSRPPHSTTTSSP